MQRAASTSAGNMDYTADEASVLPPAPPRGGTLRRNLARWRAYRRTLRHCARTDIFRRIDVLAGLRRSETRSGGAGAATPGLAIRPHRLPDEHAAARFFWGARDPARPVH